MVDFPKLITDRHLLTPVKSWIFESLSFSFFKPSCSSTFLKRFCCHLPERSNKHISALSVWTPEGFGAPVSVDTNKYNPPSGLNCCLMTQWCPGWKRMSINSGITVIALYDSTAVTTNYHGESVVKKTHTSRVIHCMLLTAAVRYLKPLFSSALMGVEMSFALWRSSSRGQITSFSVDEAEKGGRDALIPAGVKSLQLLEISCL